jgi:16S rRNA (guanine527-N7)-methyltransferase
MSHAATTEDWLKPYDRLTASRIAIYAELLRKWNPTINLVSRSSLADALMRHFADSAQLMGLCPADTRLWADIGSGGGFPGLVVAIVAAERRPDMSFVLVEADLRKAAFLRTVSRETGVPVDVREGRIENMAPIGADVLSARALAPLPRLLEFASRHLGPTGICLFHKGTRAEAEVGGARLNWSFEMSVHPSKTEPDAAILEIKDLHSA